MLYMFTIAARRVQFLLRFIRNRSQCMTESGRHDARSRIPINHIGYGVYAGDDDIKEAFTHFYPVLYVAMNKKFICNPANGLFFFWCVCVVALFGLLFGFGNWRTILYTGCVSHSCKIFRTHRILCGVFLSSLRLLCVVFTFNAIGSVILMFVLARTYNNHTFTNILSRSHLCYTSPSSSIQFSSLFSVWQHCTRKKTREYEFEKKIIGVLCVRHLHNVTRMNVWSKHTYIELLQGG